MATYMMCKNCGQKYYTAANEIQNKECQNPGCSGEITIIRRGRYESDLPRRIEHALIQYQYHHVHPGGFVRNVLENDLRGAFAYADLECRQKLYDIMKYVYNYMPADCWGDCETVNKWLDN